MSYTREQAEEVLRDYMNSGWRSFSKFLDHKFPKLPERGWLKHKHGALVFRVDSSNGYGVNTCEKWCAIGYKWTFLSEPQNWQPATIEEVQAMLEKEAERRGLVKGVKVRCLLDENVYTLDSFLDKELCSMYRHGTAWFMSTCGNTVKVMKDGIWATPIDDLQERIDALIQEAKEKGKNLTIKID